MAEKKRMSLLGGLIYEALDGAITTFHQLTKDEQKATVNKLSNQLKLMFTDIQTKTSSIRNKHLKDRVQELINEISREIDSIMAEFGEDPVEAFFRLIFFPVWFLFELSSIIWGEFFDFLRGMFEPEKPPTFEEAIRNAEKFLTLAGDFNVLATIFNLIGDFEILGTKLPGKAIGRFITNVSWTFGIGWLTWVVMGPVLRYSIADPYEKEMTRRLRPKDFTKSEIEDLYEWGLKKLEELHDYYVELGYSDEKIEQLLEILRKRVFSSEVRSYITYVEGNYVDGYVSDEELIQALSLAYWTDDERQFRFWRAKQRQINKLNDLRVKEIERAFKERRISEEEATARLSEFIKSPEMIERLIALWKQYLKPEEEIDPAERLKARKQRLEIRIKGLNDQIAYLQQYLQERLELYEVMIRELENRYLRRLQRISDIYDIRISAIKEEFTKWKEKKLEEIETRLKAIEAELSRFVTLYSGDFIENLSKISDDTLMQAGTSREVLVNLWTQARFDELANALINLLAVATEKELSAIDHLLRLIDKYYDLLGRYQTLQTIAKVRIEEREAKVTALINKLQSEKMSKINQLKAELEDRKAILEKKKELERIRTEMRIAKLQSKVDELSIELSSIEKQLQLAG